MLPAPRSGTDPVRRTAAWWLLLLAVGLGAFARLRTGSGLWLDEALSVEIARRPVPDLLEADDLDRATEIAARIPAVRLGGSVEIRPIVTDRS